MTDRSVFPDPVYRATVLEPLFQSVKAHHAAHMDAINRAHLVMLAETGILAREDAQALAGALEDIGRSTDLGTLAYTGEHEDYFFWIEAQLRDRLGDLGGALHTARSRNDMDHTMFKLALRDRTAVLMAQVLDLADAMLAKARTERATLIVAYTHGQPAQPSTFGHYLAAALEVLLRDAGRLQSAMDQLETSPMGAAAITTSGFPIDRTRVALLLGFGAPQLNSYGCIASVDYITGLYGALKLMFLHLGRVVQDMAFWTAFEIGQLYVPNSLVQISSIMPQKRNPVPIEHLRHLASATVGRCDTVVGVMQNTPFTDMNDSEGEVQQVGYTAFESGGRVLELMAALIGQCSINADRVQRTTDAACITITELADTLVRDEALSFRQAHEVAAVTARAVIAREQPLGEGYAFFCEAFERITGKSTDLDEPAFRDAVSAERFVARRDRTGGPAEASLRDAFSVYAAELQAMRAAEVARAERTTAARAARDRAFLALLER
ncbi:MAG: argininosuccinate lyase [Pseudomonadota bacterium]